LGGDAFFYHLGSYSSADGRWKGEMLNQEHNEALFFSAVSNRATGGIQAGRKRGVRYDAATPNGVDEIVLADDALPVSDQVFEQIEYLWRNGNALSPALRFAPVGVEGVVLEEIAQGTFPQLPFGPL